MNRHLQIAREILGLVGPVRIAVVGAPDDALLTQLWMAGAAAQAFVDADALCASVDTRFDAVLLCDSMLLAHAQQPQSLFERLRTQADRYVVLLPLDARVALMGLGTAGSTEHWAGSAARAGFRRSPAGFRVNDYAASNDPTLPETLLLEKIEDAVLADWPLDQLLRDRDLHMDMTREIGPRADAHLVRYALAAQWVRAGDTVLDCACGLGYGTALLATQSRGGRFIGVDLDPGSVAYAAANFARSGAEYLAGDAADLSFIADRSIDLIVSFETIERVEDYTRLMNEFARVLKPDGRIIGGVPNLWVDETGRDPNPHQFHAFDWSRLAACFDERFVIECRYRQEAPSGVKLIHATRNLQVVPLDQEIDDTEWWIVVASANPLHAQAQGYRHPDFDAATRYGAHVTDFARGYDNPWIYRSLIQMGERITEPRAARALTLDLLSSVPQTSADFGAAATVLIYSVLGGGDRHGFAPDLLSLAEGYCATTSDNPHVRRWQISLGYAAALLALSVGERPTAATWFERVQARDAIAEFSPLLATKTVAAGYWAAMIALADGVRDRAESFLRRAVLAGRSALQSDLKEVIGDPARPLAFGFPELAEVADMTSQCALALKHLPAFDHAPGRFWAAVDTRRFGLSSWAQAVEHENRQLRHWLLQLQRMVLQLQTQAHSAGEQPRLAA